MIGTHAAVRNILSPEAVSISAGDSEIYGEALAFSLEHRGFASSVQISGDFFSLLPDQRRIVSDSPHQLVVSGIAAVACNHAEVEHQART